MPPCRFLSLSSPQRRAARKRKKARREQMVRDGSYSTDALFVEGAVFSPIMLERLIVQAFFNPFIEGLVDALALSGAHDDNSECVRYPGHRCMTGLH